MSRFYINNGHEIKRITVVEKFNDLKHEELYLQIELTSSGNTTKISSEDIIADIINKFNK